MKKIYLTSLFFALVAIAAAQCSSFFKHTYNNYLVYPNTFTADITGNNGAVNLRIRTFQNGLGNKVILDNPDALSTVRYGGTTDAIFATKSCGNTISTYNSWTDYGFFAEDGNLAISPGTSYILVRLQSNGLYIYGWLKVGITPTADSVFIYSLTINQTASASSFQVGQCDNTWPSVCATGIDDLESATSQISIYPNPASEKITVSNILRNTELQVTNVLGEIVISEFAERGTKEINVSTLPQGMYFIGGKRFIKQ